MHIRSREFVPILLRFRLAGALGRQAVVKRRRGELVLRKTAWCSLTCQQLLCHAKALADAGTFRGSPNLPAPLAAFCGLPWNGVVLNPSPRHNGPERPRRACATRGRQGRRSLCLHLVCPPRRMRGIRAMHCQAPRAAGLARARRRPAAPATMRACVRVHPDIRLGRACARIPVSVRASASAAVRRDTRRHWHACKLGSRKLHPPPSSGVRWAGMICAHPGCRGGYAVRKGGGG